MTFSTVYNISGDLPENAAEVLREHDERMRSSWRVWRSS